eukprot:scaffold207348_cov33-Tisochrysis_lutea.AAC.2
MVIPLYTWAEPLKPKKKERRGKREECSECAGRGVKAMSVHITMCPEYEEMLSQTISTYQESICRPMSAMKRKHHEFALPTQSMASACPQLGQCTDVELLCIGMHHEPLETTAFAAAAIAFDFHLCVTAALATLLLSGLTSKRQIYRAAVAKGLHTSRKGSAASSTTRRFR